VTATRRRVTGPEVVGVAVGGAIGATCRYGALRAWAVSPRTFPITILLVNLVASFMLGVLLALLDDRRGRYPERPALRAFLVAGVVGALGTLSAVAVDLARLLDADRVGTAIAYGTVTLVACIAVLLVGLRLGGWRTSWHTTPEEDEL
jgi:fluoride exporter